MSLSGVTGMQTGATPVPGKTVTLTGAGLSGTDAGNYVLDSVATATASITAKHITGKIGRASCREGGNTAATVVTRYMKGAIAGDAVSLTGGTATFNGQTG